MRVLHVSEALGGGITTSILAMAGATPDIDHHLLAHRRPDHDTGDELTGTFATVHRLPLQPLAAARALRRLCRELFPDVVHAHSSWAGLLVRLAGTGGARVVYSPHCFAFERRDLSPLQRGLVTLAERRLAPRTDLLVAVAPHEIELAVDLGHTAVAYTPNRTGIDVPARTEHRVPLHVVTAGRACAQKDWHYLLHLKRYAEEQLGLHATWEWLGGGAAAAEHGLVEGGIAVSGWLDHDELVRRMSRAQVYVHTAAWEAAPMSVLEASSLGLPLVLRSITSLASLGLPGLERSVGGMATRIAELQEPGTWHAAHRESLAAGARHSRLVQGERLRDAYERACTTGPVDDVVLPVELRPVGQGRHDHRHGRHAVIPGIPAGPRARDMRSAVGS